MSVQESVLERAIRERREALDELERLRAALERVADVLEHYDTYERLNRSHVDCGGEPGRHEPPGVEAILARAALEPVSDCNRPIVDLAAYRADLAAKVAALDDGSGYCRIGDALDLIEGEPR